MKNLGKGDRVMIIDDSIRGTIRKVVKKKFLFITYATRYLVRLDNSKLQEFKDYELEKK